MKRARKIIGWTCVGLIVCLIVVGALLPTYFSSQSGKEMVQSWLSSKLSANVEISNLDLSWFGSQSVRGLTYSDDEGHHRFSVAHFNTETPLVAWLLGKRSLGNTYLHEPYLDIEKKEGADSTEVAPWLPVIRGELKVIQGHAIFSSPRIERVIVSNLMIDYQPENHLFHLTADTKQGSVVGGVQASGTLGEKVHVLAKVANFPVAIIDQVRGNQLYTNALGPTLSFNIESDKKEGSIFLKADIESRYLNGSIEGETYDHEFVLNPKSRLEFVMTPSFFHSLISPEVKEDWQLVDQALFTIAMEEGRFPLSLEKFTYCEIDLLAKATLARAELFHKDLGPYYLRDFEALITSKEALEVQMQVALTGHEEARVRAQLMLDDDQDMSYSLHSEGFPFGLLELIFEEGEVFRTFLGETVAIDLEGELRKGEMKTTLSLKSPEADVQGTLKGREKLAYTIEGRRHLPRKIFGSYIDFKVDGDAQFKDKILSFSQFKGIAFNPYFEMNLGGELGKAGKPFSFDLVTMHGAGVVMDLPDQPELNEVKLKKGTITFRMDGAKNVIQIDSGIEISHENENRRVDSKMLEIHLQIEQFIHDEQLDFKRATVAFEGDFKHLPTSFLTPLFPEGIALNHLIGPTVDMMTKGIYNPEAKERLVWDFAADASGFKSRFSVALDGTLRLNQPTPAFLHWDLTPGRYKSLMEVLFPDRESEYVLTSTTPIDIELTDFVCPKAPALSIKKILCEGGIYGRIHVGTLRYMNPSTQEIVAIEMADGKIRSENFSEHFELLLNGEFSASNIPPSEKAGFELNLDVRHLWSEDGSIDHPNVSMNGVLSLDLVPVRQITGVLPILPKSREVYRSILGSLMNARLSGYLSEQDGSLTVDVKSSNLKVELPLYLKDHVLYLRDQVEAEITLTEEVSETFLKEINPLLITGARSEHPITLTIAQEGFQVPVRPFSFAEVQVPLAIIDIGRVAVRNGGGILQLMTFLKAKEIDSDLWMQAWFSPIYVSLQNGVASYRRFDMLLATNVHIALWGRVDITQDRVAMILGIAPETIQQRFKVRGLNKKEMFQVKMYGSTKDVQMDWSSASTRIGILIARLAGGQIGNIVGGLLDQIVTALGDEPTPPPTTTPLPWQKGG